MLSLNCHPRLRYTGILLAIGLVTGCAPTAPPSGSLDPNLVLAASAAAGAASASATFDQLAANPAINPLQTLLAQLQADPTIAIAEFSPDNATILVTLADGARYNVLTDQKDRPQWQEVTVAPAQSDTSAKVSIAQGTPGESIVCDFTTYPQSKQALLVFNFTAQFQQHNLKIVTALQRAGYDTSEMHTLKTPRDLFLFSEALPNAGIIYMSSHGAVTQDLQEDPNAKLLGNCVATEMEYNTQNGNELATIYGADFNKFFGIVGNNGKSYFALTPAFFAQYSYLNSMVFIDACSSLASIPAGKGTSLKDTFRTKGAGGFIGYHSSVSAQFTNQAADAIFEALAPKANVENVTITTNPPDPAGGESYVPSAQVTPAEAGIEVRISVIGNDGFSFPETKLTDAGGMVVFSSIPGGAENVEDTITVTAGGADNSATAINAVRNNPGLQKVYSLPWGPGGLGQGGIDQNSAADFNIICNNQKVSETKTIVKF